MTSPTPTASPNKLKPIYVHELYWLAYQVSRKADAIFARFPSAGRSYAASDPDAFELITGLLSDAAKVVELLSPGKTPEGLVRSQELGALLASVTLVELKNKKLRNTIEHFGEYLDDANRAHSA